MNDDRFIELLLKDLSGEILSEEREELEEFLKDASYSRRYQLFKIYWSEHSLNQSNPESLFRGVIQKIGELDEKEIVYHDDEVQERRFRLPSWLKVAALITICFSSLFLYRSFKQTGSVKEDRWMVKTTQKGNKTSFHLPDGTMISLNSGSKLKYPANFSGNTREVYLTGEAFFDVKKDASHPFIIHTSKMNVKVLGTAFNVKAYPEDPSSETTLITGAVEVTLKDRPKDKIILKPTEKLIVNYSLPESGNKETPGSRAGIDIPNNALTQITYMRKQDSAVVETSWVQNKLIFKDEPLEEVCRSLERWYNITIRIQNEQLKTVRFTATFTEETISEALTALRTVDPFKYRIDGNVITIY